VNGSVQDAAAGAPVSAHFVNNVLAAAASLIEEDPDLARDVLAELGQFLSYRLRDVPAPVPISQELGHVATFVRLQQARFPDRISADLESSGGGRMVIPGSLQRPLAEALGRRLSSDAGPCELTLRAAGDGYALTLSGAGGSAPEQIEIALPTPEGVLQ
jgi:LytS/YehU family sensor histidine kinase